MIELTAESNSLEEKGVKTTINASNVLFLFSGQNEKGQWGTVVYFPDTHIWFEESYEKVKSLLS